MGIPESQETDHTALAKAEEQPEGRPAASAENEGAGVPEGYRTREDLESALEAAKKQKVPLSRIVDTIPTVVWSTLLDGSLEFVNQRWYDYTGRSRQEQDPFGWTTVVHPDDLDRVMEQSAAIRASGRPGEIEGRLRRYDGEYRWFLFDLEPLRDEIGNVIRWCGSNTDIASLKETEARLEKALDESKKSELQLQKVLDTIPALAWCDFPDGSNEFVNQRCVDYTGLSPKELHGWGWKTIIHPDDLDRAQDKQRSMRSLGVPGEIKMRMRRYDGEYQWFLVRGAPLRDDAGRIVRWYGTAADIESLKQAELKLEEALEASRKSEVQLQKTLDTIPTLVWCALPDGFTEFANQSWLDYTGFSIEENRRFGWTSAIHPEDLAEVVEKFRAFAASGQRGEFEFRLRRHDGEYRWFLSRFAPLRDEASKIVRWYGTNTDIDDRKRSEEELRQSERELRQITDAMPQYMLTQDPKGTPLYANQAMLDFTGLSLEELATPDYRSRVVHPEDLKRIQEEIPAAYARGLPFEVEQRARRKDGQYRWLLVRYNPFRDEQGRLVRWYASATDIDDRKRSEDKTRSENVALREEDARLSKVLDTIPTFTWCNLPDGSNEYVNQRWLDYTGFSAEEAQGYGWAAAVHPDDLGNMLDKEREAVASGKPREVEARMRSRDGEYRWFLFRGAPLRDEAGNVVRWYGTTTDIESLKQTEEKLKKALSVSEKSEVQFRRIIDAIPALAHSNLPDGSAEFANQRWLDYTGLSAQEVYDWGWKASIHPEDLDKVLDTWKAHLASGEPGQLEARMRRHDGAYRWFLFRFAPLRDEAGNIVRWYGTNTEIESLKRTEEKLRQSETDLRQIADSVPQTIVIADLQGAPLYVNQAFLDHNGFTREEAADPAFRKRLLHPEDVARVSEAYAAGFSRGELFEVEARCRRKDGEYTWFLLRYKPFRDEQGRLVRWYGTGTDVEERKKTEEALRQSERDLRLMADSIQTHVLTVDARGQLLHANKALLEYAGISLEQMLAPEFGLRLIHPDDVERFQRDMQAGFASGMPFDSEVRVTDRHGEHHWFLICHTPYHDEKGRIVRWYATGTDIEALKQAEAKLQKALSVSEESEAQFRRIIDAIPALAWSISPDGSDVFLNRRWYDYTGLSPREATGYGWTVSFHPEDVGRVTDIFMAHLASGDPVEFEARLRRHDGEYRWFLVRFAPLRDEAGNIVRWYGTNTEIEELKQTEERLRQEERKLRRITDFIPIMITTQDADGFPSYANQTAIDYTGIPLEHLPDFRKQTMHPEDFDRLRDVRRAALSRGLPFEVEQRLLGKDGQYRWFLIRYNPFRDEQGRLLHWYAAATDIESFKQADEKLRQSERELRQITDAIQPHIIVTDPSGTHLYANKALLDYTGLTLEDVSAPEFRSRVMHPEDLESLRNEIPAAFSRGLPFEFEMRVVGKDGRYHWFLIHHKPFRDDQGRLLRWYSTGTDIEALKQAEEKLQKALAASEKSEAQLQKILDTIPTLVWCALPDGFTEFANQSWLDYTGFSVEEMRGFGWTSAIHSEDQAEVVEKFRAFAASGQRGEFEFRLRRHDGEYRWFLCRFAPLRDEASNIVRWYGTNTDIEALKQTEEKLRQGEQKLRLVSDSIANVVFTLDASARIVYANQTALDYFGVTPEEILTPGFRYTVIPPEDVERTKDQREAGFASGLPFELEHRFLRHDGQYRWFLLRYSPFHDEQGRLLNWYLTATDIEDLKQADQKLRKSEDELRRITDLIQAHVLIADTSGRPLYANKTLLDFAGVGLEDVFTPEFRKRVIHPDDLEGMQEKVRAGFALGRPFELETRSWNRQGKYHWLLIRYTPFRDEEGRIVRWYSTGSDIESLKQTEAKLAEALKASRESEAQLQETLNSIPALAWSSLPDGSNRFLNQRWLDYTGLSVEAARGDGWKVTIHPEDLGRVMAETSAILASGEPGELEELVRRRDGEYRRFLVRFTPSRDQTGKIVRWYGTATDIELLKQTEAKLQKALAVSEKSEEQLRKILDTIPTLAHCNLPDGSAEFANRRWLDYTGLSQHEASGYGYKAVIHPDDLEKLMNKQRALRLSGEPGEIEARLRHRDGNYRWFLFRSAPLRDETGKIVRWYGTTTDIEALKQTEAKLAEALGESRKSEEQLREILDTIPTAAWYCLPDGSNEYLSWRWLAYTGLSAEEGRGDGWKATIHPEDLARAMAEASAILASGEPGEIEERVRSRDGEYRWFIVRYAPLRDETGKIVRWYGTNTDIETLKQTEEKLRQGERELRRITDSIRTHIATVDPSGRLLHANKALLDYCGITLKDVLDPEFRLDFIHSDDLERFLGDIQAGFASGRSFESEMRVRNGHGEYQWHLIAHTPFRDEQGQIVRWYSTATDIDSLKQAEAKLAKALGASQQSELQLRKILDTIPALAWSEWAEGGNEFISRQWLDYTGLTAEQAKGTGWQAVIHPDDIGRIQEVFRAGYASGEPFEWIDRIRHHDGEYRRFLCRQVPLRDETGRIVRWYGTATDIEALKQAQAELETALEVSRDSEGQMRKILDTVPSFTYSTHPDGNVEFVNKGWLEYTGLSLEQAKGLGWSDTIHPEDLPKLQKAQRGAPVSGWWIEVEARVRRADGVYRWFLFRGAPFRDEKGNVLRRYGTITDIDDLKRVREDLEKALAASKESENQLQKIVDTVPGIAYCLQPDGSLDFTNQRWLDYVGITSREVPGFRWDLLIHPEDREKAMEDSATTWVTGEAMESEVRLRRRDGEYRWFICRVAPLRDEAGNIVRWYGINTDIEDRKQTEAKLRQSEHELRRVTDFIPVMIFTQSPDGALLYANQTMLDYSGHTQEELSTFDLRQRSMYAEDLEKSRGVRQAGLSRGQPFQYEQRILGKDGRYRWFLVRYNPFRDEQGRLVHWYVTCTDVEPLKQAEAKLQEALEASSKSEIQLRKIIDTIPAHAWCSLPDGANELANPQWLDYMGLSAEETRGWGWKAAIHPDDLGKVLETWSAHLASGEPGEVETRLRRHDGVYRWFLFRGAPLHDEAGNIVRWYGTNTDIEELKQTEEKLQKALSASEKSEEQLRKILNTIPTAAWSLSPDGAVEFGNQRWYDYTGLSEQEALNYGWRVACHPEDLGRVIEASAKIRASGEPGEFEARLRRHDGEYRWFLFRMAPLRDEAGNIVRWYGTNTDIDGRKRSEEELRQSEHELRRMTDAIPHHVVTIGGDGRVLNANKAFLDYHGPTELLTISALNGTIHPEDFEKYRDMEAAFSRGQLFEVEARLRRHDGQYRWFLIRHAMFLDEQGRPLRAYATATDIDGRKRSEEELRQSERELRQITDAIPQILITEDANGVPLYANQTVLDYTGLIMEEMIRPDFRQRIIHPEDIERLRDQRQTGFSRGLPFGVEQRLRRKDGQYRWFLVRYNPFRDAQGRLVRWYASATDIDDRTRSEERTRSENVALREEDARLREIIDTIPALAWSVSPDGSDVFLSQRWYDYTGLSLQEATGNGWTVSFHPEDVGHVGDMFMAHLTSGEPAEFEARLRRYDGEYRRFLIRMEPLRDETGNIVRWYGTNTEIEALKETEAKLERALDVSKKSELQLRNVVNTIPTLAFYGGADGYNEFCNDRWLSYTGFSLEQAGGHGWKNAIHPEDMGPVVEKEWAFFGRGEPGEVEVRLRRHDGEYRRFLIRFAPLRDETGNIAKWYGTATDIEALKQTEEKLRQEERELRQIIDAIPFAMAVQDPGGKTLYVNQALLDYSGLTMEDLAATELRSLIVHPEDVERSRSERQSAYSRGLPFETEQRLLGKDGQYRWFFVRFSPFRDEQGRLLRWYATGTDIDDRKRAEDRIQIENVALREEVSSMFEEIVGSSGTLRRVLAQVTKVAPTDSTVLILGESGTGKELIARAIHKRSRRSSRAFIKVNLASIPASLLASELFGHEKGSFTGALQRRLGRFESAEGGTIFLDEIGELPPETQVALLRVLQEREFERVGGNQTVSVDVRVIAATNRDLVAAVAAGTFRQDLFYRLDVFPIRLPALRERADDIPLLVEYMIERLAQRAGKKIRNISKATLDLFQSYDWPGNIRELQNIVERAVILCDGETFSVDETWLTRTAPKSAATNVPLVAKLVENEKEMIENALRETRGVIAGPAGAAARLGIPRQTLESKIRKLGIDRLQFKRA
jgi:PAS domain S-box-containing protein